MTRLLFLALLSAGGPAAAQTVAIPEFDPYAYCTRVASTGGAVSEWLRNACLQQEQASYDAMKVNWQAVPDTMRRYCTRVAGMGGTGSYWLMNACIQQEQAARDQSRGFQFRR